MRGNLRHARLWDKVSMPKQTVGVRTCGLFMGGVSMTTRHGRVGRARGLALILFIAVLGASGLVQPQLGLAQSKADLLRGEYGQYRANSHLLYYHLDVRVDPEKKTISGKNTIRFKMLKDDNRIQLDLHSALAIDQILLGETQLKYARDNGAVFVNFPETLKAGREVSIDFYYSGTPVQKGRFGGFTFGKDPKGRHWIYTSCEGQGASVWWPNKDQWRDKVESMDISVEIPNDLVDVSNGKFVGKKDLGDGYTRWDWHVSYPINNYCVSLNIGAYEHFSDKLDDLDMDFYALPEDLDRAKKQFAQAKGMLEAFQHYFGEYPFKKDGYKLIQVPYSGMEHQSAVTYGNGFKNGYVGRDWTGVGISPRFDFIIIHESGHETVTGRVQGRPLRYVDSRRLDNVPRKPLCRVPLGKGRRHQVPERLQVEGEEQPADHRQARNQCQPAGGPVFQRRPLHQYAAQHRGRRQTLVDSASRLLPAFQVSGHHDRGRCRVFQQANRQKPDADFRPVPASRRIAGTGTQIRR